MKTYLAVVGSVLLTVLVIVFVGVRLALPTAPAEGVPVAAEPAAGRQLVATYCVSCHSAGDSHEQQMAGRAPPMWGVRDHYLKAYPERAAFVREMVAYLTKPDAKRSLMKGAVKRFGVMPVHPLSATQLEGAAQAVFEAAGFAAPAWWEAHRREHDRTPTQNPS